MRIISKYSRHSNCLHDSVQHLPVGGWQSNWSCAYKTNSTGFPNKVDTSNKQLEGNYIYLPVKGKRVVCRVLKKLCPGLLQSLC